MLAPALALALAASAPPPPTAPPAAAPAVAPEQARFDEALRAGGEAWARRGDPARLAEAIDAFERARSLRPGDPAAELGLARAQAFRARADPSSARAALRDCARAAERALRHAAPAWARAVDRGDEGAAAAGQVGRDGAEALYWLAGCTMDLARARGVSAVLAVKDEVRPMMERVAALDPTVDRAGPHRALGAWLAALPSAAGGGAADSRRHFDEARALAPDDLGARVREAETWAVLVQDRALFVRLLDEVLAPARPDASPALAPDNALARKEAEALRARADRLF